MNVSVHQLSESTDAGPGGCVGATGFLFDEISTWFELQDNIIISPTATRHEK